jgi:hypothetical protein
MGWDAESGPGAALEEEEEEAEEAEEKCECA